MRPLVEFINEGLVPATLSEITLGGVKYKVLCVRKFNVKPSKTEDRIKFFMEDVKTAYDNWIKWLSELPKYENTDTSKFTFTVSSIGDYKHYEPVKSPNYTTPFFSYLQDMLYIHKIKEYWWKAKGWMILWDVSREPDTKELEDGKLPPYSKGVLLMPLLSKADSEKLIAYTKHPDWNPLDGYDRWTGD